MAVARELLFGEEARKLLLDGVMAVEKAVACTLGPKGKTVIIDNNTDKPVITKDGVSVSKEIALSNPYMNLGANIVKEGAEKTNKEAGDGTTTSTILTGAFSKTGVKLVSLGHDSNDIKRGFYLARDRVLEHLQKYTRTLESEEEIKNIATISANNDSEIGEIICKAFTGVGENGIVNVMNSLSRSSKTEIDFSSGLEIETGYYRSSMFATEKDGSCELSDPLIVLYDEPVRTVDDCKQFMELAKKNDRALVLIASDFDEDILFAFTDAIAKKIIRGCLVRAPGFSAETIHENLTDLSVVLNCSIIGRDNCSVETFDITKDFGTCSSIKITPTKTLFSGADTPEERLAERCAELKALLEKDDYKQTIGRERRKYVERELARLTGGIATIYIGADSKLELKEKKDRYEDAVNAVKAAITDGISPGGGTALLKAARDARNTPPAFENEVQKTGYNMFLQACREPALRIINSTGENAELIVAKLEESESLTDGYNAKTETLSDDLFRDGVIDPIKVVKSALKYSTSVSSMLITVDCIITDEVHNVHLSKNDPFMEDDDDWE